MDNLLLPDESYAEKAWKYVAEKLLDIRTGLIYDQVLSEGILPTPEEIASLYPNVGGWGTGMEDSMISGGSMLDGCIERYSKTKSPEAAGLAQVLANGLLLASEKAKSKGFIPRSISPYDLESHYINSSRDQYTLFVFGLLRYYESGICSEVDSGRIRRAFTDIAERCEENVTEANNYDLLREDLLPSIVTEMWGPGLGNHEVSRLPMIYLAAWKVTGNIHWLEKYRQIRQEAFDRILPMKDYWALYTLQQMQMSIRVLYDHDPDEGWKEKYLSRLCIVADKILSMNDYLNAVNNNYPDLDIDVKCFRDVELVKRDRVIAGGYTFISPVHPGGNFRFFIQDVCYVLTVTSLAPGKSVPNEQLDLFRRVFDRIDLDKHTTDAPVQFLEAYWRIKES